MFGPSPYEREITFKESLSDCTYYIMKQVALEVFMKKLRDVSRTIATAKMKLFVALVSSFQPLSNFTKNPKISAIGGLEASLEYYSVL